MPSTRSLGALVLRADVRLRLALAASISGLMLALLGVLFFVASHEAAEVTQEGLRGELRTVASRLAAGHDPNRFRASASGRGPCGSTRAAVAMALRSLALPGRTLGSGTFALRLAFASPEDHLGEQVALPDGGRLEGAAPLRAFVEERREQLGQLALAFAIGLGGVLAVAAYATRLALAPLRGATRALEHIDERHLGERIPRRGASRTTSTVTLRR